MATSKPRDAVSTGIISIRMMQNVLLLWVDNSIDENSADCRNTLSQLRRAVNAINKYTDGEECIEFLGTMQNDKACMVISGSLGQHTVPRVHGMSQVDSIFIFCGSKKYHEQWVKDWPKIKGVFTEIGPICEALKKAAQYCRDVFVDNVGELENVKKFERQYRDKTPIWWYTYHCFLYPMLNRALRLMDADIMLKWVSLSMIYIDTLNNYIGINCSVV